MGQLRPTAARGLAGWQRCAAGLLGVLPVSVLLGPYAAVGPVTAFRLTTAALAVCAVRLGTGWRRERWLIGFLLCWLGPGLLSGILGGAGLGAGDLANLVIGFTLAWSLARLRGLDASRWIALGWECSVLVSAPIAFWERATTRHLPLFIGGLWRGRPLVYPFPGTFFVNPNYYALFLVIGAALMCYRGARCTGRYRIGHLALTLLSLVLLGVTQSQACQIAALCMVAGALLVWRPGRWIVLISAVVGVLLMVGPGRSSAAHALQMWLEIYHNGHDFGPTSTPVRMALMAFGLHMAASHPLLGVGPGGFARLAATADWHQFPLHGKINPHNGLIQVASEYGLIVAAGLLAAWCWVGLSSWRVRRSNPRLAAFGLALVFGAPLCSLANSMYVGPNVVALWMALIVLVLAMAADAADPVALEGSAPGAGALRGPE